jgi:hypothetical protein
MLEMPDVVRYYEPTGALDIFAMYSACRESAFPTEGLSRGFLTFANVDEVNTAFSSVSRFAAKKEWPVMEFLESGFPEENIKPSDASNKLHSMFRSGWERLCRERGLLEYEYSNAPGFHASKALVKIGARVPWGQQGENRSSMLRNKAKGYVWQFGVTAFPSHWPFFHFKLKSRVLFAKPKDDDADNPLDSKRTQHRLRRSICKGWRNKQWHGRMMAFLEILAGEAATIKIPLSPSLFVRVEAHPILFTSPVTTALPHAMTYDAEEDDDSTMPPEPGDDDEEAQE